MMQRGQQDRGCPERRHESSCYAIRDPAGCASRYRLPLRPSLSWKAAARYCPCRKRLPAPSFFGGSVPVLWYVEERSDGSRQHSGIPPSYRIPEVHPPPLAPVRSHTPTSLPPIWPLMRPTLRESCTSSSWFERSCANHLPRSYSWRA